jgi:hypothetical protein
MSYDTVRLVPWKPSLTFYGSRQFPGPFTTAGRFAPPLSTMISGKGQASTPRKQKALHEAGANLLMSRPWEVEGAIDRRRLFLHRYVVVVVAAIATTDWILRFYI